MELRKSTLNHDLYDKVIDPAPEIRAIEHEKNGEKIVEYTERDSYILNVMYSIVEIERWFEQLENSVIYIEHGKLTKNLKEKGITREEDLRSKIENYLIRLESIYDRVLILTNWIFDLGYDYRMISHFNVTNNMHVRESGFNEALLAFRKITKQYKELRNSIIHHNSFSDEMFGYLKYFALFETLSGGNPEKFKDFTKGFKSSEVAEVIIQDKAEEFSMLNEKIKEGILELFDFLEPVYDQKLSMFSAS